MFLKCLSHLLFFKQTNVYHFGDFSLIEELTIEVLNNYEIFGGIEGTGVASANYIRSMFGLACVQTSPIPFVARVPQRK